MQAVYISNAQIATSREVFEGSLLVRDGKIAAVLRAGETPPDLDGIKVIDAGGCYLLPGGVDPHTHFDLDVGFTRASDDFYTGTVAAACGGTTTVIDHMAFGPKGCPLPHQSAVYHKLAAQQGPVIDYGFHGVIQHVDDEVLASMKTLRDEEGLSSFKIYLTYDFKIDDYGVLKVLERANELGLTICVHCENDATINTLRAQYVADGHTEAKYHALSRPAEAEAEAVYRMLMLGKIAGEAKVYIVHLSTRLGLEALRLVRRTGQKNILVETCPQYLFLDDSRYNDPQAGLKYIMSPPLRKQPDIDSMWDGLTANDIQTIGTDHCPFFFDTQKQRGANDFTQCPNGAPGVELRMPLMFSEGFMKGRLSLPQVVDSCCTRPAEIFGIAPQKGIIAPGADADLVLFDPSVKWTVTKDQLHENVDYTPYEGIELTGRPVWTMARGEVIVDNGVFKGQKGSGKYLKRNI
ncbi:dihydropyrimidinase [Ruminococcaceae bacterium OttesenSCG-928-D13]|nr:dihydropyrimidinase [Ruminococcaceae bacterium OttesenSCG-928-D13]